MEDQFTSVTLERGDDSQVVYDAPIEEADEVSEHVDAGGAGDAGETGEAAEDDTKHDASEAGANDSGEEGTTGTGDGTGSGLDSGDGAGSGSDGGDASPEEDHIGDVSIQEQEMSEFFEKYYIDTSVSDPVRDVDQASKPYISYLITTKSDNPNLIKLTSKSDEPTIEISVRRRYGDFRNLYHCLNNDFPALLIPPLPSKLNLKYLTGDTFSQEFVHKRLNSLNRFIKFINTHKILSQLSVYHLFLSDSNDWINFSKSLKINNISEIEKEQSFTSNMVNKVVNEELITETVMNFLTPSKHKKETNKEILEISDKLKKMYENLLKLDKIFGRLNKKNNDLSVDYGLFSTQIDKLANLNESTTSDNFKFFAECLEQYSNNWSNSFKYINESFLTSLKDCSKYIVNLTNLIELQHNKKIDLQVLQDYLEKTQHELNNLPSTSSHSRNLPPSPIKNRSGGIVTNTTQLIKDTLSTSATSNIASSNTESKRLKLEAKVKQLEDEISLQTGLVNELINKIIYEEYPNWDKFNKTELKSSMLELCDNQIDFYKGLVSSWSDTEAKLLQRINELG